MFLRAAISALIFMENLPPTETRSITHSLLQDFKEDLLRRYAPSSNAGNISDLDVQDMELRSV